MYKGIWAAVRPAFAYNPVGQITTSIGLHNDWITCHFLHVCITLSICVILFDLIDQISLFI